MLAIVNVTSGETPLYGKHDYELRINARVLCTFSHDRKVGGLSQCLRDAADAFDKQQAQEREHKLEDILGLLDSLDNFIQK